MSAVDGANTQSSKHRRLAMILASVAVGMVGLSYAAVPAYQLFCAVTGFGGTTQVAEGPAGPILDRTIRVRFTADTGRHMPWDFAPERNEITLRIGEPTVASYRAGNPTDKAISGTAMYNVNPPKAGIYFYKVQCFCFEEQTLQPGQVVDMPVYFYVDPAMADDPNLDDVEVVTLSYTFFNSNSDDPGADSGYQTDEPTQTSHLPEDGLQPAEAPQDL